MKFRGTPIEQEDRHMKRQTEREQLDCLTLKTLESLNHTGQRWTGLLSVRSRPLVDLIREVYFP